MEAMETLELRRTLRGGKILYDSGVVSVENVQSTGYTVEFTLPVYKVMLLRVIVIKTDGTLDHYDVEIFDSSSPSADGINTVAQWNDVTAVNNWRVDDVTPTPFVNVEEENKLYLKVTPDTNNIDFDIRILAEPRQ